MGAAAAGAISLPEPLPALLGGGGEPEPRTRQAIRRPSNGLLQPPEGIQLLTKTSCHA